MSLSDIPPHLLRAAADLPENRASAEALRRAAGLSETLPILLSSQGVEGAQGGRETHSGKRGKRRTEPNKTEAEFAREILDPMVACGELDSYECEGMTLRLPHVGAVTPDYVGWKDGVPQLFEVKGRVVHEATVLRMKVHAEARPWLRWRIYARVDGAWRLRFDNRA